jgi:hypothetical protein
VPVVTPQDLRQYGDYPIVSNPPRADIASVAVEVGRIEQKLGVILQLPISSPNLLDTLLGRLGTHLLDQLLDALVVDVPATTYTYVAPCDKDGTGANVTLEQEIAPADYNDAVIARLDAISQALGVLKGWKQPVCRVSPPKGNVTVTAYEVGGEF